MKIVLVVREIIDRLGREELNLKRAGAYAEAAGIRDAIVQIFRMADQEVESIEPEDNDGR